MSISKRNKPMILRIHPWKKVLLCTITAFLLYVEIILLMFLRIDWTRSRAQEWPRYLESLSLFWIEACFVVAWTQLLAVCVCGCVRQFRRQPITRKPLPLKTWKRLFWGGAVLLVILILGARRIAPVYIAANAAQEDSAAGYMGVFYPLIIAAELVLGFLIWLLCDRLRVWRQKRKQNLPISGIETDGEREYE